LSAPGADAVRRPSDCGLGPEPEAAGLNLAGVVPIAAYDRLVPDAWRAGRLLPGAVSALVIGGGGRALHRLHLRLAPDAPLDDFVAGVVARGCQRLRGAGWQARAFAYDEAREGSYVDLVALGRRAGLGAPSRLGLLLHPEYGPWCSLRALVLTDRPLPEPSETGFAPCDGCTAPCAEACPVAAPRALPAGFDVRACGAQRAREGPCRSRCAARRACVYGQDHAYDEAAEEGHMAASLSWVLEECT
jgi:hypothetical protein